jgi:hypothetical protein
MSNNKEQWPKSYINSWDIFSGDERSEKYLCSLLDYYVEKTQELEVADLMCADGKIGKVIKKHISQKRGASKLVIHRCI